MNIPVDPVSGRRPAPAEVRPPRDSADTSRRENALRHRRTASALLLLVDAVTLALTVADSHGPARFAFGLAFSLLVPGWSVIGWMNLGNAPLEFAVSVVTSFTLLTMAGQILITIHQWHLVALQIAVAILCAPSLALLARRHRPRSTR